MNRLAIAATAACLLVGTLPGSAFPQTSPSPEHRAEVVGDGPDLNTLAHQLADEAKRLQDDTSSRLGELTKLEAELQANQANTAAAQQNVDTLLKLLNDAAGRLAPEAPFRQTLTAEESTVRDLTREAAASTDGEVRKFADGLRKSAAQIRDMAVEAEDLRTRLVAQIDRLVQLRARLKFTRAVSEVDAFMKNARAYLDHLKAIADATQNLANGLENFGHGVPTQ